MRTVGYAFLAALDGVTALPPARRSVVGPVTSVVAPPSGDRLVPAGVAPAGDDLLEHILFALKHEGVDLQILAQTLPRVRREQLDEAITATPGGIYLRKACYLWELFTGSKVTTRPRVTGASVVFRNYLELFPRLLRRCGVARRRHSPAMTSGSGPQPVAGVQAGARHAAQAAGFHPPLALPRRKIHRKFLQPTNGMGH